ncbi:MAG TPA: acetyl-CoA carboxylase biotin carboxylase subunit [Thermomicrobiales bacterium]|nr:acetyl-CoA carboxylase biotin carboxylase subunit [Thermomicrobiales bacterium]
MSGAATGAGELPARPFRKVLIANRGEIAVRIAVACREAGLASVAVYSAADRRALHVARADEAYCIGGAPAAESYLNIPAILDAARRSGADAVHPGYGFLAENADFARQVIAAGLVWIGPPPSAIAAMGDKVAAKRLMAGAGVPLVPGYDGAGDDAELARQAAAIGYPVLVKAAAGGGGRGMRAVAQPEAFADALAGARREALAAFGDERVFLEKYLEAPRHVEVQVFADTHGATIHLGERECSIQRRHQKVVEESPSPAVTPELRARMGAAAVAAARAVGYAGAGTVEFLLDEAGDFYFLEMNTRLQVEHPVTEAVTGLDLVQLQFAVAAGEPLGVAQEDVALRGHAIECRIYAEDAAQGFLPSTGPVALFAPPTGPGVRNDAGTYSGDEVGVYYDPQLAKLIVHAPDRDAAVARLARALRDYAVLGPTTNLPFLVWLAEHPEFRAGRTSTAFIPRYWAPAPGPPPLPREALLGAAALDLLRREERVAVAAAAGRPFDPWREGGAWRAGGGGTELRLRYGGAEHRLTAVRLPDGACELAGDGAAARLAFARQGPDALLLREGARAPPLRGIAVPDGYLIAWQGRSYRLTRPAPPSVEAAATAAGAGSPGALTAPMPGKIIKVHVAAGDRVEARQPLLVLEAMKMEHTIAAPYAGTVARLPYAEGDQVPADATLAEIERRTED